MTSDGADYETWFAGHTPGKWRNVGGHIEVVLQCINGLTATFLVAEVDVAEVAAVEMTDGKLNPIVDADLIAEIPALLADNTSLRAECERLRAVLEETVSVLDFAFTDGALPHETIIGLCIDPYGLLADAKAALAPPANTKGE